MTHWIPIVILALIAIGFPIVTLVAARFLRHPNLPSTDREPYECGNEPESLANDHRFSIRYYLIAVLFVIFDVETVFLYPWAARFDHLGLFGFVEMILFLTILVLGYVYVWKEGALDWQ